MRENARLPVAFSRGATMKGQAISAELSSRGQLRWRELEMVGDAGLRQAARRVGEQLVEVEAFPREDRHDLRWRVERLADEVRLSLEHSWGYERNLHRETATREMVSKLPTGCKSGRAKPGLLPGMIELKAPGNLGPRETSHPMSD